MSQSTCLRVLAKISTITGHHSHRPTSITAHSFSSLLPLHTTHIARTQSPRHLHQTAFHAQRPPACGSCTVALD
ncbi:uncharacterized protein J3R85_014544 [Psidium guajava]|nr:uncharacterized protein J3R85_014544 [Psidium guajava]